MLFAARRRLLGNSFSDKDESHSRSALAESRVARFVLAVHGIVAFPLVLPILPPARIAPVHAGSLGIGVSRTPKQTWIASLAAFRRRIRMAGNGCAGRPGLSRDCPRDERAQDRHPRRKLWAAPALSTSSAPPLRTATINQRPSELLLLGIPAIHRGRASSCSIGNLEDARYWCQNVEEGPKIDYPYTMGWEHYTILICHGLKNADGRGLASFAKSGTNPIIETRTHTKASSRAKPAGRPPFACSAKLPYGLAVLPPPAIQFQSASRYFSETPLRVRGR